MNWKTVYEGLLTFMSAKDRIMSDPKTKTDPRKRLKILDEWHTIWAVYKINAKNQIEKSIYMSLYNMLTNTIVYGFNTLDELNTYLNNICIVLVKASKEYMSEER